MNISQQRHALTRDQLRTGLVIAARMARVEYQAARDDGLDTDTDARGRFEERADEHQLKELVNGDPRRWWEHAISTRPACGPAIGPMPPSMT